MFFFFFLELINSFYFISHSPYDDYLASHLFNFFMMKWKEEWDEEFTLNKENFSSSIERIRRLSHSRLKLKLTNNYIRVE